MVQGRAKSQQSKLKPSKPRVVKGKTRPVRPKLDPRLDFLLSVPRRKLLALKREEDQALAEIDGVAETLQQQTRSGDKGQADKAARELAEIHRKLFAPATFGLYLPSRKRGRGPIGRIKEPYVNALILSEASAKDLQGLGAVVRCQQGDIFTASVPLSAVKRLEQCPAVRYLELARPLFPTLDTAIPHAGIDTLHAASTPVDGAGVIVGIVEFAHLDFYHPDFRDAANNTRVLFLWDQALSAQGGEAGPPIHPVLPGFNPTGGSTYGVEYDQAAINAELAAYNPPVTPAYQTVRHGPWTNDHSTKVAGCAAGNGRGQGGTYTGAAPKADIIFVRYPSIQNQTQFGDRTDLMDAFNYIFARAAELQRPCVVNLSNSDDQGPHDGTTLGEQFLDQLLLSPGRAITLAAGNSNNQGSHASVTVAQDAASDIVLNYQANSFYSDAIEVWYDGHDRLAVTMTIPTATPTIIGPVAPGTSNSVTLANNVSVTVTSVLNDPRNGNNSISIIIIVPLGQAIPPGDWTISLAGTTVINGRVDAWVDRNNRSTSDFQSPSLAENVSTLGVPATARGPITVGACNDSSPTPVIRSSSGRGPSLDGRIKPDIAAVGTSVMMPVPRDMNAADPAALPLYASASGTSFAAPIVAGACALLFQCRGGDATCADLKQILQNTAGTTGLVVPGNDFGFGFLKMGAACTAPAPAVDVWARDDVADSGVEPFVGPVFWASPDIAVLDANGTPTTNPSYNAANRYNNIIRVTVRNRGTDTARNTEVYLYWADPATSLPFPQAWNSSGIYAGAPDFLLQGNMTVIPELAAGAQTSVDFAWAPPPPGSNLRGDNHFCLLARLENQSDPSDIGIGGWSVIPSRNNMVLRNVLVREITQDGDGDMALYVRGGGDHDGLRIFSELDDGTVRFSLPVRALPWRQSTIVRPIFLAARPLYGANDRTPDPVEGLTVTLEGDLVEQVTDVKGAVRLELRRGIATLFAPPRGNLFIRRLRLAPGARLPAHLFVRRARFSPERCRVHAGQLSGGERIGGVALELWQQ